MIETTMPAAEAGDEVNRREPASYELAFHVLPTVAEGEVATVFQSLKDMITKAGGTIVSEETPARFDLAYDIVKYLEGRNRKFASAYFGWVRFSINPSELEGVTESVDGVKELLRHLIIKLTKVEEENTFFFHEALAEQKVETVEVPAGKKPETVSKPKETEKPEEKEASKEVKTEENGADSKDKV